MKRPIADSGPLLPSEASTIITFVAGLIGLGGAMTLLALALALLGPLMGAKALALTPTTILGIVVIGAFGVGYCVTGLWLYQARRRGAYLAMGALALNVLSLLLGASRPSVLDVMLPVAALVGVALAWPHLSEAGREVEEQVRIAPRR